MPETEYPSPPVPTAYPVTLPRTAGDLDALADEIVAGRWDHYLARLSRVVVCRMADPQYFHPGPPAVGTPPPGVFHHGHAPAGA